MINTEINNEQREEFEKVVKPVIEFINKHGHPHCMVVITTTTAEIMEGLMSFHTKEFIQN